MIRYPVVLIVGTSLTLLLTWRKELSYVELRLAGTLLLDRWVRCMKALRHKLVHRFARCLSFRRRTSRNRQGVFVRSQSIGSTLKTLTRLARMNTLILRQITLSTRGWIRRRSALLFSSSRNRLPYSIGDRKTTNPTTGPKKERKNLAYTRERSTKREKKEPPPL